jgi:hypothetical protein
MNELARFSIGSEVLCSDGTCGVVRRVVVDPVARALTHLVVEPQHGRERGHLVPVGLVASTTNGIALTCPTSELEALEEAEETQFPPGRGGHWGYMEDQMLSRSRSRLGAVV